MTVSKLKKYLTFSRASIEDTLAWKFVIMGWLFGGLMNALIMGLLWFAIYSFSPNPIIGGYTYAQMLLYVIAITLIGELTYTDTYDSMVYDIKEGLIGIRLLKPIDYRTQNAFYAAGSFCIRLVITVPLMIAGILVCVFNLGMTPPPFWYYFLIIPAAFLSLLICDSLHFLFGMITFKTQAGFGLSMIMSSILSFLSGGIIALSIFPEWAQTILYYTPFPYLVSFPANLVLGTVSTNEILIQFVLQIGWCVALYALCLLLFKLCVRHVVVFGG